MFLVQIILMRIRVAQGFTIPDFKFHFVPPRLFALAKEVVGSHAADDLGLSQTHTEAQKAQVPQVHLHMCALEGPNF